MKTLAFLLALLLQAPPAAPLVGVRTMLKQLSDGLNDHKTTYGATPQLTEAKHQLRDWVESQLTRQAESIDMRGFADRLHGAIAGAGLLCDDCDWNHLGYVDDVRVRREGGFLVVVTATGISCGYDESAYAYAWDGRQWRRVWEHEQDTYTQQDYQPQTIHDVQISAPDANQNRLLMVLGSQTICGGAFKNIYARAWQLGTDNRPERVLDRTERANDEYPPIEGRLLPGDVLFKFTAGGFLDGDVHTAVRHFRTNGGAVMMQVDPIAGLPRDFVLEWLDAPWDVSRGRAESAALQAAHAQLHRTDGVGDFAKPTLRCTAEPDVWQVHTHLFESPDRYYRVRWKAPFTFTLVAISETSFADCTESDSRGETYQNLLNKF